MGIGKKIFWELASTTIARGGKDRAWLRRMLVGVALAGVAGLVVLVVLGVVAFKLVSGAIQAKPDADLLALEKMVAEQVVVLDARQQEQVRPLLIKLASPDLPAAEQQVLKKELWGLLAPAQRAEVERWKNEESRKASGVTGIPGAITGWLDQFGLPASEARQGVEAILAWLRLRIPDNNAEDLLRQLPPKEISGQERQP
ncbi:MAG: hypothetical protein AB1413_06830 [Thermodesulfobacteriota bacterium]